VTVRRTIGPVEKAVRSDLKQLGSTSDVKDSLEAAALVLARELDTGDSRSPERLVRELRDTLRDLAPEEIPDDDLTADLSAPVLHPA
jgi:hypothetical protein